MTPTRRHLANFEADVAEARAALTTVPVIALIAAEMAAIRVELPALRALVDTHQAGLGFLSVEAAKVQDDLIRQERADRVQHARDRVTVTGITPAPGSINAISLLAEWSLLLYDADRFLTERLEAAGVCVITAPRDVDAYALNDLLRYTRVLELLRGCRRSSWLRRFHADVVDLRTRITRCIDGNQVKAMPDPCPWCHLPTLVADLTAGVITCSRDPHTGQYQPCICSDSYCACKTPGRSRHTWHRDHKAHKTTSWQGLRRAINTRSKA